MDNKKFYVSFEIMEQLFSTGILHNSSKDLLSADFKYYITKSKDGGSLQLILECNQETDVLTSLTWDRDYDATTNPWIDKKCDTIVQHCDQNQLELNFSNTPIIQKHYGMHDWPLNQEK